MHRHTALSVALFLAVAVLAGTDVVSAQEPREDGSVPSVAVSMERDWTLRFGFLVADTGSGSQVVTQPGSAVVSFGGGGGFSVSVERRVSPLVGIEFGVATIGSNIDITTDSGFKHTGTDVDILIMTPLSVGVDFHFVKDGPVDVYAGPLLAYTRYSELSARSWVDDDWWHAKHGDGTSVTVRSKIDSEFSWGAKAGLDIFLGARKRWSIQMSLTYLDSTYEFERGAGDSRSTVSLDPLIFGFGAGWRF
jgi:outer membrane protein W